MDEIQKQTAPADTGTGVQSETDGQIKRLNEETERLNRAIAENENAKARARLGGVADAGQPQKEENPAQKIADEITKAFRR